MNFRHEVAVGLVLTTTGLVASLCFHNRFECSGPGRRCIPATWRCNGARDCYDGSDEEGCFTTTELSVTQPSCNDEFQCGDGQCIAARFKCDGHRDCFDNSDEKNCTKVEHPCVGFRCVDSSRCVSTSSVCNGINDCDDGSDEVQCHLNHRNEQINRQFFERLVLDNCLSFRCDNEGPCISDDEVCNGKRDCPDGSDEEVCSNHPCPEHCDHFCKHHRNESTCGCRPGYRLVDKHHCAVVDSCIAGGCSQKCEPSHPKGHSVECACEAGFQLTYGNRCKIEPRQGAPFILFSSGHQVHDLDAAHHEGSAIFGANRGSSSSSVLAFDMLIRDAALYVVTADLRTKQARLQLVRRGIPPRAVFERQGQHDDISELAIDWITGNLYMVDAQHANIVVCQPHRAICTEIFNDLTSARYLVLHPTSGHVFWSNFNDSQKGIYKGSMDGRYRMALVTGRASNPYSLAIDMFANRLYWLEASSLRVAFVHIETGIQGESIALPTAGIPFALTTFGDRLYWSDLEHHHNKVSSCDVMTGGNVTVHTETGSGNFIFALKAFHTLMQPSRHNPCRTEPCSHLCVIGGPHDHDYSCLCPKYYKLISKTQCAFNSTSIMIAAGEQLIRIPLAAVIRNDSSAEVTLKELPRVSAMAIDEAEDILYAVEDTSPPRMLRIGLKDDSQPEAMNVSIDYVTAMHFDSSHGLLYWLDISQKVIVVYNPKRSEETRTHLQANISEISAIDFAVDFRKGRVYVIATNDDTNLSFIDVCRPNGKRERTLTLDLLRPRKITVDQHDGTLFVYDVLKSLILSIDPVSTQMSTVLHSVVGIDQLHFRDGHLVWSGSHQRGLFTASPNGWTINHYCRDEWTSDTSAVAVSGERMLPIVATPCQLLNGGCSHTCISSLQDGVTCLCPIGMQLGADKETCTVTKSTNCKPNEFACANRYQCIGERFTCDGTGHCDDRSDETSTLCNECPSGMQNCLGSTRCISQEAVCDGDFHCANGSDERSCISAQPRQCIVRRNGKLKSCACRPGRRLDQCDVAEQTCISSSWIPLFVVGVLFNGVVIMFTWYTYKSRLGNQMRGSDRQTDVPVAYTAGPKQTATLIGRISEECEDHTSCSSV